MPNREFAPVEPDLLVWARESIGYDIFQAAKKIGVRAEKLVSWENGELQPTVNQLKKIASTYKRPLAVFFLPKRPSRHDKPFSALDLRDFRRLPETTSAMLSTSLLLELKKAEERREVTLNLLEQLSIGVDKFTLDATIDQNPEQLARNIRTDLGVTIEQQYKWGHPSEALKNWIHVIEEKDVLIFQTGFYQGHNVELEEMRGVAISLPQLPIIIINGKDVPSARIFTLIHEFGHLLLRVSGISDVFFDISTNLLHEEKIEVFCNRFAAEMLIPMDDFLSDKVVKKHLQGSEWSDEEIHELAIRFGVSREVIVRKLLTANIVSVEFYQQKRRNYQEEYRKKRETKKKSVPVPRDRMLLKWHGTKYITTVLDAYQNDVITMRDVHGYLGAKTPQIEKLQRSII